MDVLNYFTYLAISIILLVIFTKIYLVLTPYDELALIRQGNGSACISLAGTLIGFSLTLAASAIYNNSIGVFVGWACLSMIIQVLGYIAINKVIGNVTESITKNNMAVGGLIGLTGLLLGIINAGCLS